MLDGFRDSRVERAQELAASLAECLQKIRTCVSGLSVWHGVQAKPVRRSVVASVKVASQPVQARPVEPKPEPTPTPTLTLTPAPAPAPARVLTAFAMAPALTAKPVVSKPVVSKPVVRAPVVQKKVAQPAVAVKKAAPVKAGRPAGKVAVKSKKR